MELVVSSEQNQNPRHVLNSMRLQGEFCDAAVVSTREFSGTKNFSLAVHCSVLFSSSPVLYARHKEINRNKNVRKDLKCRYRLAIPKVSTEVWFLVLDYIYLGTVTLNESCSFDEISYFASVVRTLKIIQEADFERIRKHLMSLPMYEELVKASKDPFEILNREVDIFMALCVRDKVVQNKVAAGNNQDKEKIKQKNRVKIVQPLTVHEGFRKRLSPATIVEAEKVSLQPGHFGIEDKISVGSNITVKNVSEGFKEQKFEATSSGLKKVSMIKVKKTFLPKQDVELEVTRKSRHKTLLKKRILRTWVKKVERPTCSTCGRSFFMAQSLLKHECSPSRNAEEGKKSHVLPEKLCVSQSGSLFLKVGASSAGNMDPNNTTNDIVGNIAVKEEPIDSSFKWPASESEISNLQERDLSVKVKTEPIEDIYSHRNLIEVGNPNTSESIHNVESSIFPSPANIGAVPLGTSVLNTIDNIKSEEDLKLSTGNSDISESQGQISSVLEVIDTIGSVSDYSDRERSQRILQYPVSPAGKSLTQKEDFEEMAVNEDEDSSETSEDSVGSMDSDAAEGIPVKKRSKIKGTVLPEGKDRYTCHLCNRNFFMLISLARHRCTEPIRPIVKYHKCLCCGIFVTASEMKNHLFAEGENQAASILDKNGKGKPDKRVNKVDRLITDVTDKKCKTGFREKKYQHFRPEDSPSKKPETVLNKSKADSNVLETDPNLIFASANVTVYKASENSSPDQNKAGKTASESSSSQDGESDEEVVVVKRRSPIKRSSGSGNIPKKVSVPSRSGDIKGSWKTNAHCTKSQSSSVNQEKVELFKKPDFPFNKVTRITPAGFLEKSTLADFEGEIIELEKKYKTRNGSTRDLVRPERVGRRTNNSSSGESKSSTFAVDDDAPVKPRRRCTLKKALN